MDLPLGPRDFRTRERQASMVSSRLQVPPDQLATGTHGVKSVLHISLRCSHIRLVVDRQAALPNVWTLGPVGAPAGSTGSSATSLTSSSSPRSHAGPHLQPRTNVLRLHT